MTKLERVTGITLLAAIICALQISIFERIYNGVAMAISDLAKAIAAFI